MQLAGQVVIITGGGSGLGAATARRFAEALARVAILDIDAERGAATADELGAVFAPCDVADEHAGVAAMAHVVEALGRPTVLVCCAGVGVGKKVVGRSGPHSLDAFDEVVRVNLRGTFNMIRLAAAEMQHNEPNRDTGERGVIVTTSSIAAYDGVDGGVAYAASKAGVAGMTLPLARDLAPQSIRAVSIAPGSFETPLVAGMPATFRDQLSDETPFPPRFGLPDEFAQLAEQIVVNPMLNGEVIRLDGGLRMRPSARR